MDAENKQEVAEVPKQDGAQAINLIDQAKAIRDEIRAENDRREALLKQEQELHAVRMLSGTATAGQEPAPIDPKVKKKLEAAEFFKGTAIEDAIMKYG